VAQRGPEEPTDPVALERILSPAAPTPPPRNNLYDDLLGEEPSEVKPLPLKPDTETLRKQILSEYLALSTRNHYQVLGVPPDAGFEQIAAAHAAQLERFRLERFSDAELGADYAHIKQLHQAFTRAFDTIGTPELRSEYDRNLAAHRPPSRAPIDAELLAKQADALLRTGDAARARAKLAEAVAAAPDEASYHARLGWASFLAAGGSATRAPKEALNDAWPSLEQALALDGDDADAHQFAGRIAAAAGDDDRAVPHLGRALDAQPTHVEALAALEAACARKGTWRLLERRYRTIIHRLGNGRDPLRVSLWGRLAELYATRLDDPESARVSYEVLAKLGGAAPPRPPTATPTPPTPPAPPAPPTPPAPPGARFREQLAAERWDAAFIAASVAGNDAEAAEFHRRYRPRFLQRAAPIDPAQLLSLRHPDDDASLGRVLALVCAAQPPTFGLGDLGVSDGDQLAPEVLPTPFARVAAYAAGVLGVEPPPVYRRGDFGAEVSIGGTQPPVLMAGPQALALSDRAALAFRLGRALSSLLPQRCAAATLPARQLKESLLAALLLVSPKIRVEDPDGNAARLRDKLTAGTPQLARELQPLVEKLLKNGTLNLSRFTRGLTRTADRIGLLLCGDPSVALRLIQDADAAAELTSWALSDEHLALRDQLGLSVAV
jgi:tetratricopeptide (TPR) repeat protein